MQWKAKWIRSPKDLGEVCPRFGTHFELDRHNVQSAVLHITAQGSFVAHLNDGRIGDEVMMPGWTSYRYRLQYMTFDITDLLKDKNTLSAIVGKGWYRSHMSHEKGNWHDNNKQKPAALLAQLEITYKNGDKEYVSTDENWDVAESEVRASTIYDGETLDATFKTVNVLKAEEFDGDMSVLIPREGEPIREMTTITPRAILQTPSGETVVDFGQNITGYVQIAVDAKAGDGIELSHGEVLDKDGNFYNANYRAAKAKYSCTCADGLRTYKPLLTFYGFRYVRVDRFPCEAKAEHFKAIAVHSDLKQTIDFNCSDARLNHLFQNILWGQRDNFLDVPTDCPQRDERLGWTGDAQVFVKTACYNYNVERFFKKWLRDMQADQLENGRMPHIVPALFNGGTASAAWGDAATICPFTIYTMYGDLNVLREHFPMMKKWVDFITQDTKDPYLWTGGSHYGDWLGLDAPSGSYKGSSRDDLIASAYYAYSTSLVVKAGAALGEDVSAYETLYDNIVRAFRERFDTYETQTECALAVHFRLAKDLQETADLLAEKVKTCGHLQTGFVGTPYLLHALSDFGHTDLAYSLLLREEYPSWLYAVNHGATTMWEHWDGVMEDGSFWSTDMNSFNHYAYGAVADWMYGVAAGVRPDAPGFARVRIAPTPDKRLDWLKISFDSRHGKIVSGWRKFEGGWRFEIETPVETDIVIDGEVHTVSAGSYVFFAPMR